MCVCTLFDKSLGCNGEFCSYLHFYVGGEGGGGGFEGVHVLLIIILGVSMNTHSCCYHCCFERDKYIKVICGPFCTKVA